MRIGWALLVLWLGLGSAQAQEILKVGVLFSRSGAMAANEVPLHNATLLALDEINRQGGIELAGGRRLRLVPVVADGASDPQIFRRQAAALMDQGVHLVFGCWTSDSRVAVLREIEGRGGLLFYPVQFEGQELSPAAVYSGLTANQQLFPVLDYARRFGPKVYLVGSDYLYPRATNALCRKYWGAGVVGESYRPRGSLDFAGLVGEIRRSGCNWLLNTINGDSQRAFFAEIRRQGLKAPIVSLSLSESQARSLGHLTQGTYIAWGYFSDLRSEHSRLFEEAYHRVYGEGAVDDPCQTAYAQVRALAQAVSNCGKTDRASLRKELGGMILDTPAGLIRYEPSSLYCWRPLRIAQFSGRQARVVWSSDRPIRPEPFPQGAR